MVSKKERNICILSPFLRRLYCAKKRINAECRNLSLIKKRCPNLVWTTEDVKEIAQKGTKEIESWSGFTSKAIEYAERFRPNLRLKHKGEIVKPRRRLKKVAVTAT
jgi:hypothetical protein